VHTPPVVAYHDSSPDLYLAPNLRMCTFTSDIHYLCPSKQFVKDTTRGLCGLKLLTKDSQCLTTLTPKYKVNTTQVENFRNRWLVNTPAKVAIVSYDLHYTSTKIELPNRTLWVTVPEGAILHLGDLTLYHLNPDQCEDKISDFYSKHPCSLMRTLSFNSNMKVLSPVTKPSDKVNFFCRPRNFSSRLPVRFFHLIKFFSFLIVLFQTHLPFHFGYFDRHLVRHHLTSNSRHLRPRDARYMREASLHHHLT